MNGISLKQNPPKCFSPLNGALPSLSVYEIHHRLRERGCSGCELGTQTDLVAPVVYRGNRYAKKMIIGEAPGKLEDSHGKPFVGPAGELLDKIFASVGWDTNKDWYLGNVIKCRPIATHTSWKQNFTPTEFHHDACRPYINQEIRSINPHTIVVLGKTARDSLLPSLKSKSMQKTVGDIYGSTKWPNVTFFVMYHPAYLLHSQKYPDKYAQIRKETWEHIQLLKEFVEEQEHE